MDGTFASNVTETCENYNTGLVGTLLKTVDGIPNWESCRAICKEEKNCTGWNWFSDSHVIHSKYQRRCALLSAINQTTFDSGVISGNASCDVPGNNTRLRMFQNQAELMDNNRVAIIRLEETYELSVNVYPKLSNESKTNVLLLQTRNEGQYWYDSPGIYIVSKKFQICSMVTNDGFGCIDIPGIVMRQQWYHIKIRQVRIAGILRFIVSIKEESGMETRFGMTYRGSSIYTGLVNVYAPTTLRNTTHPPQTGYIKNFIIRSPVNDGSPDELLNVTRCAVNCSRHAERNDTRCNKDPCTEETILLTAFKNATNITKGQLVGVIPKLEKQWEISFDLYPNVNATDGYTILHLTTLTNWTGHWSTILSGRSWEDKLKKGHAISWIGMYNQSIEFGRSTDRAFPYMLSPIIRHANEWIHVRVQQIFMDGKYRWIYHINGDDVTMWTMDDHPTAYENVTVYASNPESNALDGSIRNLVIRSFASIDGGYSEWSEYNRCTKTCGGGNQTRYRTCSEPVPYGGANCSRFGPKEEVQSCNTDPCPVHGGFGEWSEYTSCNVTCGGGSQVRNRSCDSPIPRNGGRNCSGPSQEERRCNTNSCHGNIFFGQGFTVDCESDNLKGAWEKTLFPSNSSVSITLNNPACNAYETTNTHFFVSVPMHGCGAIVSKDNDTIVYENTARIMATQVLQGTVTRKHMYIYKMRCEMDRRMTVSTSTYFNASGVALDGGDFNDTADAKVDASIDLYSSSSFNIPADSPITVTSQQPMFVGINQKNNQQNVKLVVTQCLATPTRDIRGVAYTFFDKKCPLDPSFKQVTAGPHHFNFQMDAFTFIEVRGSVYIHCHLFVCPLNSTSSACQQQCHLRQRRSADNETPLDELSVISEAISFRKVDTCVDTTCPLNAVCIDMYPAVCRCKSGYVYDLLEGECRNENLISIRGIHLRDDFVGSYSDPTSVDFYRYAIKLEEALNKMVTSRDGIIGVKVVKATKGSVVVDVLVLHSPTVTSREAYDVFVSVLMAESNVILDVKREKTPYLSEWEGEKELVSVERNILLIAIVVPCVVISLVVLLVLKMVMKKRVLMAQNAKGIDNVAMEQRD